MAAAAPSLHQGKAGSVFSGAAAAVLITALFGCALFSVDNILLDKAQAGWNKILLIEGSFAPSADARSLYQSASAAKALDQSGLSLPDVSADGKIRQYDPKIIQQAVQERRIAVPPIFFQGVPGGN